MNDPALELKATILAEKVKHYLVTLTDKRPQEANDAEFYQAVAYAMREEIMVNWAATRRALLEQKSRVVYYISMEYLPGRIMGNNVTNLGAQDLVQMMMKKLGRDWTSIVDSETDPGLGNGGLGRLASCYMDSLATLRYPAMGYGLRYQYGVFAQEIWDGVQVERPEPWLLLDNPWHARRDFSAAEVKFCGRMIKTANEAGDAVYDLKDFEEVRALPYDTPIIGYSQDHNFTVLPLRLWTTKESPRNFELQRYNAGQLDQAAENMTLTDVLYPSDHHDTGKRIRLKQEFLLSSASTQDIISQYLSCHENFDDFADKVRIQINDTHPACVIAELMRLLTKNHNIGWDQAWEMTRHVVGFTNHTILAEALEEWNTERFEYLLPRQYKIIERINQQFCDEVRSKFPDDEERVRRMSIIEGGQVKMAHLSIYGSHHVNGVAALHTEILKRDTFKDFFEMFPGRFVNVTNGVTPRRWLMHCNPKLSHFITERIGDGWKNDLSETQKLRDFAGSEETQKAFLEIKLQNKEAFADFVQNNNILRDQEGRPLRDIPAIDPTSLFDIHIKRIHEYKRQLMNALHTIMLYQELCADPNARKIKRTIIVAGKAAAGYRMAKHIIRLFYCLGRVINNDNTIGDALKIVFVENYSVTRAQILIPAADLSQQISTAGTEASGTGNMKLSMNGALTIGTEDGANIEMREQVGDQWWPFRFGHSAEEIDEMRASGTYRSWDAYSQDKKIRNAVETLRDHTFAHSDDEHEAFSELYDSLLEGHYGHAPDFYFILKDLPLYYECQKKVEDLFCKPNEWAEHAIHNMAGMGKFSSDRSIHDYAEKIWDVKPLPADAKLLERVMAEYAEHVPTLML